MRRFERLGEERKLLLSRNGVRVALGPLPSGGQIIVAQRALVELQREHAEVEALLDRLVREICSPLGEE